MSPADCLGWQLRGELALGFASITGYSLLTAGTRRGGMHVRQGGLRRASRQASRARSAPHRIAAACRPTAAALLPLMS